MTPISPAPRLLAAALLTAACAGGPEPQTLPPQTLSPNPAPTVEPEPEPPAPEPEGESEAPEMTIVIEPGGEVDAGTSLIEAARRERERRSDAGAPTVVLTDKNLKQHGAGAVMTSGSPPAAAEAPGQADDPGEPDDPGVGGAPAPADAEREDYWRGRVLQARLFWRERHEEVGRLETEIAELRMRFYAEDDPYHRDTQIKPAWDRALVRLEDARGEVRFAVEELDRVLEEGRRDAALPGWLREGSDLEPPRTPPEEPERRGDQLEHRVSEPVIATEDDGGRP